MSTAVTYVGTQYNVPAYQDTGYAQGTGNLSSYLIALATGSLTLSGGTFTLTADANFGGSFGLVALYYKSRGATLSTAGVFRMANAELIGWRNQGDGGNLTLGVNASDRFAFTGGDVLIATADSGVILTSTSGFLFKMTIDDSGNPTFNRVG